MWNQNKGKARRGHKSPRPLTPMVEKVSEKRMAGLAKCQDGDKKAPEGGNGP